MALSEKVTSIYVGLLDLLTQESCKRIHKITDILLEEHGRQDTAGMENKLSCFLFPMLFQFVFMNILCGGIENDPTMLAAPRID